MHRTGRAEPAADSLASHGTGDPYARKLRGQLAAHVRNGNTEAAAAVRRTLTVHQLGKHIREAVPVLSPDDAAMLRGLLSAPDGREAVAA